MSDQGITSDLGEGMVKSTGAIIVVLVVFVVAPCTLCGGMLTCGHVMDEVEEPEQGEQVDEWRR